MFASFAASAFPASRAVGQPTTPFYASIRGSVMPLTGPSTSKRRGGFTIFQEVRHFFCVNRPEARALNDLAITLDFEPLLDGAGIAMAGVNQASPRKRFCKSGFGCACPQKIQ